MTSSYIGRFAPSPSGRLHFGSLVAAVASYCDARANDGKWLVRIEDVDGSRTVDGAADDILRTLEGFGMYWDGNVVWQSQRSELYGEIVRSLKSKGQAFDCACTRKQLLGQKLYPGFCRNGLPDGVEGRSVRFLTPVEDVQWSDLILGNQKSRSGTESDFIIKRADGYFAYHLAVVADDEEAGVTRIVRGEDLLESTPAHIHLQNALGYSTPEYAHFKLALNDKGTKLSKANKAQPVEIENASEELGRTLKFLGIEGVTRDEPGKMLIEACSKWTL
ncbi:MAG: tRNA glutamyl-Q(34) synthetase GluQRS [Euryarchaeota archaeon]|nr:tRNA glutamyl-Q(34) synthetase GluQRS [Euryarchaeota archaeon]|tara:strand:- start:276 stop:1103 length:828 start_codon:yes stop_codon:yes gene_type:complete